MLEVATGDPAAQLEETLRRHRWNVFAAARELGLSRPTVYRWMKVYEIVPPNAQG
ncbi:Bacterial regulatory protein, Fis family [compost metagenome]